MITSDVSPPPGYICCCMSAVTLGWGGGKGAMRVRVFHQLYDDQSLNYKL